MVFMTTSEMWLAAKQLDSKSKYVAEIGNLIGNMEMSSAAGMPKRGSCRLGWAHKP
jgi:hypothetical protein